MPVLCCIDSFFILCFSLNSSLFFINWPFTKLVISGSSGKILYLSSRQPYPCCSLSSLLSRSKVWKSGPTGGTGPLSDRYEPVSIGQKTAGTWEASVRAHDAFVVDRCSRTSGRKHRSMLPVGAEVSFEASAYVYVCMYI